MLFEININYIYSFLLVIIINIIFRNIGLIKINYNETKINNIRNIVYLTNLKYDGIKLYIMKFLYSYYEYFYDFINGFCLIISLFQIFEYNDFRSFIPLIIFSTLYSIYNLYITYELIKHQNRINNGDISEIYLNDIIELDSEKSDIIPCDIQILNSDNIVVNELELTGENICIIKNINDIIYRGTILVDGKLRGKAIAVGNDCCIYNINHRNNKIKTKLYIKIMDIIFNNLYYLLILSALTAGFGKSNEFLSIFKNTTLLLNTIVPLSLQSFYNTATYLFSKNISNKNDIIINSHGIYSFHNIPKYIVTDKTGTITKNSLKIEQILNVKYNNKLNIIEQYDISTNEYINNILSCSSIKKHSKNNVLLNTDELEFLLLQNHIDSIYSIHKYLDIPFSYDIGCKYSITKENDKYVLHLQGIPEMIETYCTKNFYTECENLINEVDNNSYCRIICHTKKYISEIEYYELINYGSIHSLLCDFDHMNIYVFSDLLSDDLSDSFNKIIKEHHLTILTGDSYNSVKKICDNINLDYDNKILYINGRKLNSYNNLLLYNSIISTNRIVIYRATPITKESYINILQTYADKNHSVMMIGDGHNDIPAIMKADIGISIGNRTNKNNMNIQYISDIIIDKWNKIPDLIESFNEYHYKLKHIINWIITKHILSASILATYYILSDFYYSRDPISPYYMLVFNSIIYIYMCILCINDNIIYYRNKSTNKWIYQGILYGITIGIITYENINNIYNVIVILLMKLIILFIEF